MEEEEIISLHDAATMASVTLASINHWVDEGILIKHGISRHPFLYRAEVVEVVRIREENPRGWKKIVKRNKK